VVAAILAAGEPLARATLLAALAEEGIPTDGQRGYHMLLYCSLIGLTCIGPQREGAQTIALLSSWAPRQRELTRDEALAELAHRYFRSHGPATLQDFAGWTGLTLTDARRALELNDGRLVPSSFGEGGDRTWWATQETALRVAEGVATTHKALALPGFDEYMLGYKDRSLHGDASLLDRVVPGGNGVFRASVVRAGVAVATWTRTLRGDRVEVEVQPFRSLSATAQRELQRALETYASYLQRRLVVRLAD
jgi:hypothetical protein